MSTNYDDSTDSVNYWERREAMLRGESTGATTPTTTPTTPSVLFYKNREMGERARGICNIATDALNKIKAQPEQARSIVTASKKQIADRAALIKGTGARDKQEWIDLCDQVEAFLGVCWDFNGYDSILDGALDHVERYAEAM